MRRLGEASAAADGDENETWRRGGPMGGEDAPGGGREQRGGGMRRPAMKEERGVGAGVGEERG